MINVVFGWSDGGSTTLTGFTAVSWIHKSQTSTSFIERLDLGYNGLMLKGGKVDVEKFARFQVRTRHTARLKT